MIDQNTVVNIILGVMIVGIGCAANSFYYAILEIYCKSIEAKHRSKNLDAEEDHRPD